ncbi:putative MYND domain protein [Xylariaceae sp. FL1272]|nr:putative MYND domain protein [Xylariaceae sp. FL1272]
MSETCNACEKSSPDLKRCAKCQTARYCSKECQKTDWKMHKKICGKQPHDRPNIPSSSFGQATSASAGTTLSPPKGLDKPIAKPFSRLTNGTYLHDRPEIDVYRYVNSGLLPLNACVSLIANMWANSVLIDAYRLRIEDEYTLEGNAADDSIYGGRPDSLLGFTKFLRKAKAHSGLLPAWWNVEKEAACKELGMDANQWCDLRCAVEKSDIIEHYGDSRYPMQLRMLAEAILGRGLAGGNDSMMRTLMATMEGR